jgi:hypothetical protein
MLNSHCVENLVRRTVRLFLIKLQIVLTILVSALSAQTFTILHTFAGDDGSSPYSGVTVDRAGNVYGTTKFGGVANCDLGCGVLFKLAPQGSGWNFVPLYKFATRSDGYAPIARIVFGLDGRLYGTTFLGGNSTVSGGTLFTLTPPPTVCRASCYWVKTTLWSFGQNDGDGLRPGYGDLVFDAAGNIYGTTEEGGTTQPPCGPGCGTVYMLSRSQGSWNETLLYQFGDGPGYHPYAGVAFAGNGNLYGTTPYGGSADWGLAYELSHSNGSWSPTILYNFSPQSGGIASAGLLPDNTGDLYGATSTAVGGGGAVFELSSLGLDWTFQLLHSFDSLAHPFANLAMDAAGNLYGTTLSGGRFERGNVFKLTRIGDSWTYSSLYDFTGGSDGSSPYGDVALDAAGNLYGTAAGGGSNTGQCLITNGCGVVWRIKP